MKCMQINGDDVYAMLGGKDGFHDFDVDLMNNPNLI